MSIGKYPPPVQVSVQPSKWSVRNVLVVLAVAGCLLALADMPDDFYKVLRFVVVAACVAVIWTVQKSEASEKKKTGVSVLFGLLAVIFNPVLPLEMERETWAWFDAGAALAFVASACVLQQKYFGLFIQKLQERRYDRIEAWSGVRPFTYFKTGFNDEAFVSRQLLKSCYQGKTMHEKVLRATWSGNFIRWATSSNAEDNAVYEESKRFQVRAFSNKLDEDVFFERLKNAVNSIDGETILVGSVSIKLPNAD